MPPSNVNWPPPLTRFETLWPGQMGVPGTDHDRGERMHCTGEVFYVDPNFPGVSDARDGTSPTSPLATVGAALARCQDYRGDTIAVMANGLWVHANSASGYRTPVRESVTVSVPGVRIVGLFPSGSLGIPWYPAAAGGTCITVSAIDVLIEGFNFSDVSASSGTAISAAWNGTTAWGDNLTVRHCFFYGGPSGLLDYGVRLTFSYYSHIHHCRFDHVAVTAINDETASDSDYVSIHDNLFMWCGNAVKLPGVAEGEVYANRIVGDPTGTNNFIDTTGGTLNVVSDNWLGCTLAAAQYATTCTGGATDAWCNNHCIDGDAVTIP